MLKDLSKLLSLESLPETVQKLITVCREDGGFLPLLVGGCVRDAILSKKPYDFDVEVHQCADAQKLEECLRWAFGDNVCFVGKDFGVFKVGSELEVCLPRADSKSGSTHKDFEVVLLPKDVSYAKASQRRDFTINSMGYDSYANVLYDPYQGVQDLKDGVLRCVDNQTFSEDPLRPWRAVQFIARLHLKPHQDLYALSQKTSMDISAERVYGEFKKLFQKENCLVDGWAFLVRSNLARYHKDWHVHITSGNCADEITKALECLQAHQLANEEMLTLGLFVMTFSCRNLVNVLKSLNATNMQIKRIKLMYTFWSVWSSDRELNYFLVLYFLQASSLGLKEDVLIALGDVMRAFAPDEIEGWRECVYEWIRCEEDYKPIVEGKDLVQIGVKEGPHMGDILRDCHRIQITEKIFNKERLLFYARSKIER